MEGWCSRWLSRQMASDEITAAELQRLLVARGVRVSDSAVRAWCAGDSLPSAPHMHALLEQFLAADEYARDKASGHYLAEQRARAEAKAAARCSAAS